jgi:acyl-coenzyme A thioesterase PaaI-like protein
MRVGVLIQKVPIRVHGGFSAAVLGTAMMITIVFHIGTAGIPGRIFTNMDSA